MHPAENRGYRELYLSSRQGARRLERLASAFADGPPEPALAGAASSLRELVGELRPLTASHDLHSRPAAEGGGAWLGSARSAVFDRFLERNQALRLAVCDVEHVTTLLLYLATVSEGRGDHELPAFCRAWERRLRRDVGAVRAAAVEIGGDPDLAIRPLDESIAGRAAHRVSWALGTVGEWTDRSAAHRRRRASR